MGRFLAIALTLVAVGLAVNHFINSGEALDAAAQASDTPVEADTGPTLMAARNSASAAEDTAAAAARADSGDAPDGAAAASTSEPNDADAAANVVAEDSAMADDSEKEAGASGAAATAASVSEATSTAAAPSAGSAASAAALSAAIEEVMLGKPELTTGIPGVGPLTVEEIKSWLGDSKNHATLRPQLPLGLAAGAQQIVGLDSNPLTRAKIELGRQLFFDPRLSSDGTISCASCHDPDFGYAKDTQFGIGVANQVGGRNSPVAYNRILSSVQFWDGRAETLEEQAKGPIANPIEMSNTHEVCIGTIAEIEGYRVQFEEIFPDGVTIDNIARAIASFERALVTSPTPWDYYVQLRDFEQVYGPDLEDLELLEEDDPDLYAEYMELKNAADEHPIGHSARRGGELFFSDKAGCTACHVGANFADELYHNLGVGMDKPEPDLGRYVVTGDDKDRGAFKTPTIRNVAHTAPYMHDGSQKTLEEVVDWYNKGGHPNPYLSDKIKPLNLSDQEKADLVAFMKALTGDLPQIERGRLPE